MWSVCIIRTAVDKISTDTECRMGLSLIAEPLMCTYWLMAVALWLRPPLTAIQYTLYFQFVDDAMENLCPSATVVCIQDTGVMCCHQQHRMWKFCLWHCLVIAVCCVLLVKHSIMFWQVCLVAAPVTKSAISDCILLLTSCCSSVELCGRMLLWHGSRLTNMVGILSSGLRVAPPEAPVTGYMVCRSILFFCWCISCLCVSCVCILLPLANCLIVFRFCLLCR